jgi:hypothetical protein
MIAALSANIALADYTGRAPLHIIIDIARPILFLGVIITLRQVVDAKAIASSPALRRLLPACIWATLAGVLICTGVDAFVKGIYPAFSSIDSVLGLGWLMATGVTTAPLLFLSVLIFSGKRAVYLAAGVVMLLFYRQQPQMLKSIITLVCLGLMISAINVRHHGLGSYTQIAEYYSGGRLDEIYDAIEAVPSPTHYLIGMGPGFAYPSATFAKQGYKHRNLHFTPLSLIIYYGLVFSSVFAFYIFRMLPAAWRALNNKSNPIGMSYAVYFLASLPFALTEYSVFAYANVAIACGLIAAFDRASLPTETT